MWCGKSSETTKDLSSPDRPQDHTIVTHLGLLPGIDGEVPAEAKSNARRFCRACPRETSTEREKCLVFSASWIVRGGAKTVRAGARTCERYLHTYLQLKTLNSDQG